MKTFQIIDSTGDAWGLVTERSAEAAVEFVMQDYAERPEAYMGRPEGLQAVEEAQCKS